MGIEIQVCCHASWDNDCHPGGTLQYQIQDIMKPDGMYKLQTELLNKEIVYTLQNQSIGA